MSSFEKKIAQLWDIYEGRQSYHDHLRPGDPPGSAAEQAMRFRIWEMMPDIVQRARLHMPRERTEERAIDALISLAGFSPATTILAYKLLRPRRLAVIYSQKAEASIDLIGKYLQEDADFRFPNFRHHCCDPTDPLAIYQIVSAELAHLKTDAVARPRAVIDITGGKKVMSATAALAAWQLDLSLCYLDGEFDPALRQPIPGTERLLMMDNPTTLFGVQEMENARQVFNSGAYEAARSRYEDLSNRISQPAKARFLRDLAGLYRAWCDLDLTRLPAALDTAETSLEQARILGLVPDGVKDRLRRQFAFLRRLRRDEHVPILLCYYLLGLHYRKVGRHDFAALLFYRTLEGCMQKQMELRFAGFRCDKPDYTLLVPDHHDDPAGLQRGLDDLLRRYNEAAAVLGPEHRETSLPRRLGYMNSAGLLFALEDRLFHDPAAGIKNPKDLLYLLKLAEARNRSVLAHGFQSITAEQSDQLRGKALGLLRAFWKLHCASEDVDELADVLQFIRMES